MKRIYHPTSNVYRDVPKDDVKAWTDLGWKTTNPGHVMAAEGGVGEVKKVTDDFPTSIGAGVPQAAPLGTTDGIVTASTQQRGSAK